MRRILWVSFKNSDWFFTFAIIVNWSSITPHDSLYIKNFLSDVTKHILEVSI
jgi:hypothetical protein